MMNRMSKIQDKLMYFIINLYTRLKNKLNEMIKSVILSTHLSYQGRLSDGLTFCENSEDFADHSLQTLKMKIRKYHIEVTALTKAETTSLKQIQNASYGIYYRVFYHVVFTVIVQSNYPVKLVNAFIQVISLAFFDAAKCILGADNLYSRLEAIEGSHYFIKFDRTIKQKKKEFEDPNSMKNTERLKKQLDTIHGLIKQNMNMLEKRQSDLERTEEKAYKINEESKNFEKNSKNLVWHLWIRKNLIWLVLILFVVVIYLCL